MNHVATTWGANDPKNVFEGVLGTHRRVLFTGPAGIGKSTLVDTLAGQLERAGRSCHCLSADPGSPLFGVPGALTLARRVNEAWSIEAIEALCTLDAGRFRLPLVAAVTRLAQQVRQGVLLVDGPGVVRGIGGAELLPALVQAADIEAVVVLTRAGKPPGLEAELAALGVETYTVTAAEAAQRPGKNARARARTAQWEAYLADASAYRLPLSSLQLLGTPPPTDVAAAWVGRQVALLDGANTRTMGEVLSIEDGALQLRLAQPPGAATGLLTRDAMRNLEGQLTTATPFVTEPPGYLPPPDIAPTAPRQADTGPRVVGRVGTLGVSLINGVFGDPLLHVRLRHQARSLLFDLGEGARLSARTAHQVSDVFITHTHIDHIAGFLWLLRSRIGEYPPCRMFGPPGLADNVEGLTRGILWDRIEDRGPQFEIAERHGDVIKRFRVQAGRRGCEALGEEACEDGIVLREPGFSVRAVTLDHGSTQVQAYALEPARQLNVRKDRLATRALAPGPWLGKLKAHLQTDQMEARLTLPDGQSATVSELADEFVLITPGKKLVYATDFADTESNRTRLTRLAHNAHTFFCESTFLGADAEQAARTGHLTTRACGEIATEAQVARLVPFHFSRRYEEDVSRVYEEISAHCSSVVIPPSV